MLRNAGKNYFVKSRLTLGGICEMTEMGLDSAASHCRLHAGRVLKMNASFRYEFLTSIDKEHEVALYDTEGAEG